MIPRKNGLAALLSGQVTFILSNGSVYTIDVRSYPGRTPEEPDNEKVVRGSRDGFTENIVQNTALIEEGLEILICALSYTKLQN